MKIYNYHFQTGEYLSEDTAQHDPVDQGNWLIPAYATKTEPPKAQAGKARVFTDGNWTQVVDQRGVEYWLTDGSQHTVTELGISKPEDALDAAPPPTQGQLWESLRSKRDGLLRDSDPKILLDYPHADDAAKQEWITYRQALRDLPENTTDPANPVWPVQPTT